MAGQIPPPAELPVLIPGIPVIPAPSTKSSSSNPALLPTRPDDGVSRNTERLAMGALLRPVLVHWSTHRTRVDAGVWVAKSARSTRTKTGKGWLGEVLVPQPIGAKNYPCPPGMSGPEPELSGRLSPPPVPINPF